MVSGVGRRAGLKAGGRSVAIWFTQATCRACRLRRSRCGEDLGIDHAHSLERALHHRSPARRPDRLRADARQRRGPRRRPDDSPRRRTRVRSASARGWPERNRPLRGARSVDDPPRSCRRRHAHGSADAVLGPGSAVYGDGCLPWRGPRCRDLGHFVSTCDRGAPTYTGRWQMRRRRA